jgi:uncharacterized protein YggE
MVSVVKRVLEFLLGLMLLAMVGSALMANEEKDTATVEEDMINVPGVVATITVPADTYTITLNVESNNDNGTLASSENKAAMNETVKALIALGVNESSISPRTYTGVSQSQSSNVVCDTVGNDTVCKSDKASKNVLTSTKYVKLNTTNTSFITKILEAANSTGANATIVDYGLIDKSSAIAKARQRALDYAESIAKEMAAEKGVNLGQILNVVGRGEYIEYSNQPNMMNATSSIDVSYAIA